MGKIIDIIILIITIIFLVAWQFITSIFPDLKLEYIMAALVTLLGGLYLHIIDNFKKLNKKISLIDTFSIIKYDNLQSLLKTIEQKYPAINHLRIFDLTSKDFLSLFATNTVYVKECTLILKNYHANDPQKDEIILNEIAESIVKWEKLVELGNIKRLNIIHYYNIPTDYFCLIDEKVLITGFVNDKSVIENDISLFVDIGTNQGSDMVKQYLRRFENTQNSFMNTTHKQYIAGNILAFANRTVEQKIRIFKNELSATKTIYAIGIANNELTSDLSTTFYIGFFNRSGKIKLMFANPNGENIALRETHEYREKGTLSFFIKHNLEDFIGYIKSIDKEKQNYEIRLYEFYPRMNCIITDNYVFVHYYGNNTRGLDVPTYVIPKENNESIYQSYLAEFEALWELGNQYNMRILNENGGKKDVEGSH